MPSSTVSMPGLRELVRSLKRPFTVLMLETTVAN